MRCPVHSRREGLAVTAFRICLDMCSNLSRKDSCSHLMTTHSLQPFIWNKWLLQKVTVSPPSALLLVATVLCTTQIVCLFHGVDRVLTFSTQMDGTEAEHSENLPGFNLCRGTGLPREPTANVWNPGTTLALERRSSRHILQLLVDSRWLKVFGDAFQICCRLINQFSAVRNKELHR